MFIKYLPIFAKTNILYYMDTIYLAQFYKALSEPVRLRIVNLLLQRDELCVCDIVTTLSLPQSVVSRHLAYLKKGTLVKSRRQGNWQYYALTLMEPSNPLHYLLNILKHAFQHCTDCNQDVLNLSQTMDCC
ncbi:MAG: ArsR family transcriptional regulator [Oleiphilaceae bacterium]|jgi:ArsR family transcriptional regulator